MYKKFFGFRERPFKLVPNPAYLYLSRCHEEALAHLNYALCQGDGFVEVTGEVGTGKTTLCRTFLEHLDETVSAAYIFNPKLDALQLLKSINDELEIDASADNTKALIDTLNAFLIQKRTQAEKVIILIDEAQNLSQEVLEQLRLLSNLETTRDKLLQIILVGQPELGNLLDSHELRQLGQRITLSCHLFPLTFRETREYVRHRLHIASGRSGIPFSTGALRAVYRYSGGIPRLINIACDRALLVAFGVNRRRVNRSIARAGIRELASRGVLRQRQVNRYQKLTLAVSLTAIVLVGIVLVRATFFDTGAPEFSMRLAAERQAPSDPVPERAALPAVEIAAEISAPETTPARPAVPVAVDPGPGTLTLARVVAAEDTPGSAAAAVPVQSGMSPPSPDNARPPLDHPAAPQAVVDLAGYLETLDSRISRNTALGRLYQLWQRDDHVSPDLAVMDDDGSFFRLAAQQQGLQIRTIDCDLELVKQLDLPVAFGFDTPAQASPVFLVVNRIDADTIYLEGGSENRTVRVDAAEFRNDCAGRGYLFWENYYAYSGTIPIDAPKDSILTLKMHLRAMGYDHLEVDAVYDADTRRVVKAIQHKNGLVPDGYVGPLTQIVLYNEKAPGRLPHLQSPVLTSP